MEISNDAYEARMKEVINGKDELLRKSVSEIRQLRQQNQLMTARLEMFKQTGIMHEGKVYYSVEQCEQLMKNYAQQEVNKYLDMVIKILNI